MHGQAQTCDCLGIRNIRHKECYCMTELVTFNVHHMHSALPHHAFHTAVALPQIIIHPIPRSLRRKPLLQSCGIAIKALWQALTR